MQSIQQDINTVQSDLSKVQSLGASPQVDASSAIAAGQKTVTDTQNAINWAQQHAQSLNSQAQQVASSDGSLGSTC
jgi:hypothetical protein